MRRVPGRRSGVTLIELALVTLILLTLAGLSAPAFKKTITGLSAKNTAFSVSKLMNYAQEMAVIKRNSYKISFDPNAGTYRLLEETPGPKGPVYTKISGRYGRSFRIGPDLRISGEKKEAVFYPDGHCDEITVTVSSKSSGYAVHARRFGNMVNIREVEPE